MPRYVIGPDVTRRLAQEGAVVAAGHQLVAPTLLYRAVRRGELTGQEADQQLTYVRGLQIRLLGDRVLQSVAWTIAAQLGWPDTLDAEYVALTQLQADALITLDAEFAAAVRGLAAVAPFEVSHHSASAPKPRVASTRRVCAPEQTKAPSNDSRRTVESAESRSTMWCE